MLLLPAGCIFIFIAKNSKQMPFLVPCSDLRPLAAFSSDRWYFSPIRWSDPKPDPFRVCAALPLPSSGVALGLDKRKDPPRWSVCTADELHYVSVPNSDWNLALWRYLPSPKVHSLSLSLSLALSLYVYRCIVNF